MTIIVNGTTLQAAYVNGVKMDTVYADNVLVFRDAPAADITAGVYANRSGYIRQGTESNIYQFFWYGDYVGTPGPFGRYTYARSTVANFSNASLPALSTRATVVVYGSSINGISSLTSVPAGATAAYGPSGTTGGIYIALYHVDMDPRDITQVTLNWYGVNTNLGNWTGLFVLPGYWGVASTVSNMRGVPSVSVPGGQIAIAQGGEGFYNSSVFGSAYGISTNVQIAAAWYNQYWTGIYFNTLSTAQTLYTPTGPSYYPTKATYPFGYGTDSDGYYYYDNRLTILYKLP